MAESIRIVVFGIQFVAFDQDDGALAGDPVLF